jgi:hypothetical protein
MIMPMTDAFARFAAPGVRTGLATGWSAVEWASGVLLTHALSLIAPAPPDHVRVTQRPM